ncbi:MAG TPA: hypothetical protein VFT95_05320 [Micromonosporaceae bacterium]|nr:hypothetical protein [Micromonosporaceae bacterium]
MSVSPLGSSAALALGALAAPGQPPDPAARQAQVNAQADLLQAMRGVELPTKMVAALSDGRGIDLYV